MATHDYDIANQSGAAFRTDLNNALAAIQSNNSNASSPATTVAYQWWADTNAGVLKIRNSANNAWIELLQLDGTITLEDGSAGSPALAFRDDLDTGIFSSGDNVFNIATTGVSRLQISASGVIFNDSGADVDFRVEGDTDINLLFVNAGEDGVCIGNNTVPTGFKLSVNGDLTIGETSGSDNSFIDQKQNGALEIINSGRDDNDGSVRINRSNTVAGGTTKFRDTLIYNGKGTQLLFVDGSANRIGIGSAATSPSFMLDVQHATDNSIRIGNTNSSSQGSHFAALVFGATHYNKAYMAAHSWEFYVNGSSIVKRFEMQSGGDFKLNDGNVVIGAAGHGIDFSDTSDTTTTGATMDNELFDDYEEGNFVPQIGLGGTVSSYTIARGSYTRIGDVCFFQIDMMLSGSADGNNLRISALPFNSQNQSTQAFGGAFLNYSNAAFSSIGDRTLFHILSQDNKIQIYNAVTGNVVAGTSTGVDIFSNKEIVLQGFYKCT